MSTDIATSVRTTCPYCGVGCGVLAPPGGGPVAGDPDHPANYGRLCSKGSALGETLGLEGRLLHPEIHGKTASWDDALSLVATRFSQTIAAHGPDSVALYVSGQLLTEDYYAANKLAKAVLGTANIDSNSRLCMASAVAGHKRGFGEDVVPCSYEDLELADVLILVGSNTAWCHPVLFQRVQAARAERPEMKVVVIDPRRTNTAAEADLHLPLAPGSDVALFGGLLAECARRGFVSDRLGDPAAALAAAPQTVAETASLCGLDAALVQAFFDLAAPAAKMVTLFSQGVNQSSSGTDKVNAILNVHLATGRIGKPGAGPFSITGQPNAMGGREVGALATMMAGHLEYDRAGDGEILRAYWGVPDVPRRPGLKAVDLFRAIGAGTVKAVWIIATNPAVSMPQAREVAAALMACPFVVVSDCMRETDTMDLAHVRFPALGWGEKDGTVTNSERVISRQRPFLTPPGEAKPDWWIAAEVARRMGHAADFAWQRPADVFREHAGLSGFRNVGARVFDISALAGLDDAGYDAMRPTQWPCPASGETAARLFADGRFPTATGRASLPPTVPTKPMDAASDAWPLILLTGRVRDQWHTMTRTGKSPRLMTHQPEPVLSVHPGDAGGIEDGGLARITSSHGDSVMRVRHDPGLRRGTVFAPMHWTSRFCATGRVNHAVNAHPDRLSGQPELKHTPVRLAAFAAGWHGFILARSCFPGLAPYEALVPLGPVWRHELAGDGAPEAAFIALRGELGGRGWIEMRDPAHGRFRAVRVVDGRAVACLFIDRTAALPPRDWLLAMFDTSLTPLQSRALLAARAADGPPPSPTVCVCHGVDMETIRASIRGGCGSVGAVGEATKAGTGCGSCKPEIRAVLDRERIVEPAPDVPVLLEPASLEPV
jgi:assimilatory nitrate reductase catalytic subunit